VGTTTAALALAAAHATQHSETWLVEADPAGGVLSGRMRFASGVVGGLERLAFPLGGTGAEGVGIEPAVELSHEACGVRVITAPADPFRAHACHRPRHDWIGDFADHEGLTVIDLGRVRVGTPVWPVVERAAVTVVVANPEVVSVVSSVEWLHDGGRVAGGEVGVPDGRGRLLVVDAPGGVAFPRQRLERELADACVGWLPWEPAAVDAMHRGAVPARRPHRHTSLMEAACDVMAAIEAVVEREEVAP
jgi:hypothetical protein